jgi:hypothetical protein
MDKAIKLAQISQSLPAKTADKQAAVEPDVVVPLSSRVHDTEPEASQPPVKAGESAPSTAKTVEEAPSTAKTVETTTPIVKAVDSTAAIARAPEPTPEVAQLPAPLQDLIEHIRAFSAANARDVKKDEAAFWVLKVPAIVTASGAGILTLLGMTALAPWFAFAAAAATFVDAVNPRAPLRNAHKTAVSRLQTLQRQVKDKWITGTLKNKPRADLIVEIMEYGDAQLDKIAKLVEEAEASLKAPPKSG